MNVTLENGTLSIAVPIEDVLYTSINKNKRGFCIGMAVPITPQEEVELECPIDRDVTARDSDDTVAFITGDYPTRRSLSRFSFGKNKTMYGRR